MSTSQPRRRDKNEPGHPTKFTTKDHSAPDQGALVPSRPATQGDIAFARTKLMLAEEAERREDHYGMTPEESRQALREAAFAFDTLNNLSSSTEDVAKAVAWVDANRSPDWASPEELDPEPVPYRHLNSR